MCIEPPKSWPEPSVLETTTPAVSTVVEASVDLEKNRNAWADALESGKYEQAVGELRDRREDNAFCCLGVLCEINDPSHWKHKSESFGDPSWVYDRSGGVPPDWGTEKWVGLSTAVGNFQVSGFIIQGLMQRNLSAFGGWITQQFDVGSPKEATLANLNDAGFTFGDIAWVIRQRPTGLFKT